jgi:hypothetical protein
VRPIADVVGEEVAEFLARPGRQLAFRERPSPPDVAGIGGTQVGEQQPAHGRPDAVRAHEQVEGPVCPVGEAGTEFGGTVRNVHEILPEVIPRRIEEVDERRIEGRVGREAVHDRFLQEHITPHGEVPERPRRRAHATEVEQSVLLEVACRHGVEHDPRPPPFQGHGRPFEDVHLAPDIA